MKMNPEEITAIIKDQIKNYNVDLNVDDVGTVIEIGDGIAHIHGLTKAMAGELLDFGNDVYGLALNLDQDDVGAVILGGDTEIKEGATVKRTKKIMQVPVGENMVGRVVKTLEDAGAMEYSIVVAATAADSAPLQYLAPYAGVAMAEYFMYKGGHALCVYDDLTKHAAAYRAMSLLLRRPPGREAYPGDVFYLHSRLLERAAKLSDELGAGSITALPVIETLAGDLSAYIPTNVISITDGQIMLETDAFYSGIRPAINVGLSVSRVGGSAQIKAMKQVAGTLRLDLAQYRELAAFAQFGSDLDKATKEQLDRGARMVETLKQPQYTPLAVEDQVLVLFTAVRGFLADIPVEKVVKFQEDFIKFMHASHADIGKKIAEQKKLDDALEAEIKKCIEGFKETISYRVKE